MDYLNNCTTNFNYSNSQRVNYQNRLLNPAIRDCVSISFSGADTTNDKKKKNNLIAYIIGGLVLLAGAAILIKARKNKILSSPAKNAGGNITPKAANNSGTSELAQLNNKMAQQLAETTELEKQLAISRNNITRHSAPKPEPKPKESSHTGAKPQATAKSASTVKSATIEEQTNHYYDMYADKLSKDFGLKGKRDLIREVIPDIMPIHENESALQAVLEILTPENKAFVTKQAIPTLLRNESILDGGQSIGEALKIVSVDTIDCLDKLAKNAEAFKIKNQVDTLNILRAITAKNKDFAFNELFPYLAQNAEKYRIHRGGYMAKFLDVVTPQNKDFILNEALPTLLKNSESLNIDIIEALKIVKHLNKDNLKNVQTIAENVEKLGLKDADGFIDVDKFVAQLNK